LSFGVFCFFFLLLFPPPPPPPPPPSPPEGGGGVGGGGGGEEGGGGRGGGGEGGGGGGGGGVVGEKGGGEESVFWGFVGGFVFCYFCGLPTIFDASVISASSTLRSTCGLRTSNDTPRQETPHGGRPQRTPKVCTGAPRGLHISFCSSDTCRHI